MGKNVLPLFSWALAGDLWFIHPVISGVFMDLHIWYARPWTDTWFANVFFHSMGCLFTFLLVSIHGSTRVFNCNESNLFYILSHVQFGTGSKSCFLFCFLIFGFFIQLQLYDFSPYPSTPPKPNPPPSTTSTLPLDFGHVSRIVVWINFSHK